MMPVPRPKGPSPEVIRRRRLIALTSIVGAVIVAVVADRRRVPARSTTKHATPPPAPVAPKPFRIVFPEGFTRAQMAVRVHDVARIARRKSHKPVKLNAEGYLRREPASVDPVLPAPSRRRTSRDSCSRRPTTS